MRWGDLNDDNEEQLIVKPKWWCKHHRKVIYRAEIDTWSGLDLHQVNATVKSIAKKKGVPCIWYRYNTSIDLDNFHHKYDYRLSNSDPIVSVDWTEPDTNEWDDDVVHSQLIFEDYYYPGGFDCQWTKRQADTKTQGTHPSWLYIDFTL